MITGVVRAPVIIMNKKILSQGPISTFFHKDSSNNKIYIERSQNVEDILKSNSRNLSENKWLRDGRLERRCICIRPIVLTSGSQSGVLSQKYQHHPEKA